MSYFVPASAGFIAAVQDKTSLRYYRLYIDTNDDDVLEDVTSQISNNQISGGAVDGQGQTWQVVLRNVGGIYKEGALAGAKCRIDAKCGDNEYITIFTGYVDRKGVNRQMSRITDDKVVIKMYDYVKHFGTTRKTGYYNLIGFTICDPSATGDSIFHKLALDMGLTAGQLDISATLDYEKDYLPLDGKNTAYKELQLLSMGYLGKLNFRYDGKLRFNSPFMTGWSAPASEWTLNADNIHTLDGDGGQVLCNYVETGFDYYETIDARVIHKNLQLWNTLYEYNEITVSAGEYWPGGSIEGKVATLQFKDPATGEAWEIGINVRTPTIGAYGSGSYDIECAGGLLTLHSFNGVSGTNAALTEREPNGAQIILKNETGSTVTIRKLTIWGQPLRILSKEIVKDYDNSVDPWNVIEKKIDGKYMANVDQAYQTCRRWNEYGRVPRTQYNITTDWLPQVQIGAAMTIDLSASAYPPDGIDDTFEVVRYQHTSPNGPMGRVNTKLVLSEYYTFDATGAIAESRRVFSGAAAPEVIGTPSGINDKVSYVDAQIGYTAAGGVTAPEQPTITECRSAGARAIQLRWNKQLTLTNFDHYEVQVSDDDSAWFALRFDGASWKGETGGVTNWYNEFLVHPDIPLTGDADDPDDRRLHYRVRQATKLPVYSDYSTSASADASPVGAGDLGANSIYANNIIANEIKTFLLRATEIFLGLAGTGTSTSPDEGDRRAFLDEDEIKFEEYTNGGWSTVNGIKIGGAIIGLFLSMVGCKGIYHPQNPPENAEYFPDTRFFVFNWENNVFDQFGDDNWASKTGMVYDSTYKKFGTYSLTAAFGTGAILYVNGTGVIGDNQSAATWVRIVSGSPSVSDKITFILWFQAGTYVNQFAVSVVYNGSAWVPQVNLLRGSSVPTVGSVTLIASTSITESDWHYIGFSYDAVSDILYLIVDNAIYSEDTIPGSWGTGSYTAIIQTLYSSVAQMWVDEYCYKTEVFIEPAVYAQHYNHGLPWDTEYSAADIILRCNTGGRIVADTQQDESAAGWYHQLAEADKPSAWLVSVASPTSWTTLDCSNYVPYGLTMVRLKIFTNMVGDGVRDRTIFLFRPYGSTVDNVERNSRADFAQTNLTSGYAAGYLQYVDVPCDQYGKIQYKSYYSPATGQVSISIEGYWI